MPYVDQGEPRPTHLPPILPIIAVVLAMAVAIGCYWLFYTKLNLNQWLAPLITGPLIGAAIRFSAKRPVPRAGLVAVLATLATCLVGYVVRHVVWILWADPTFQPTVGHAFEYLFSADMMSILLMGMSAYLAFTIGGAIPRMPTQPPAQQP